MKNKLLPLMMLLCFVWLGGARAAIVEIGDPASTTTNFTLPVNMYYNYSLTQQIFNAEEIGTAGTINFIAFDYAYSSPFSMENVQVYMKNVEKETFESNTDMVAISSSDKVWEGTFSATGMGWVTLTLDTPFEYDGNSNLLVCFYDPTSGYPGQNWKFRTTATTDYQAIAYYNDNSTYIPNLNNLSSYGGYKNYYQYRSNIQIGITPDPNWTPCEKPQNLVASVYQGNYNVARVDWTGGSSAYNVECKKTTETEWTRWFSNISNYCLLTSLEENTEYQIRVQSICGTSTSGWTYTTHTTPFACNPVSNLHVNSLSHTSVSLGWEALESNCVCRLEWKKSSDSEWIVLDQIGCGAGFGPGLDSNTSYTVRVSQYCNNGHQSDWEQISFTTLPNPMTVPFLEEFSNSTIPADWTRYTGILYDVMNGAALQTSSYGWDFGTKNGAFNNSPHAYLNIYGTGRKHWLVTPLVNLVEDCLLSFDVAYTAYSGNMGNPGQSGTDDKFVVLVSTNGGISWQILRQWDNQGSEYVLNNLTPNGETVELDLAAYTGNVVKVAFYGESTITNADNDLHIDNVSIDLKPLCWDMKVNEITLSNISPHAVTIGWDVNGGATAWDIQCSSAPDFQSDLHEIGVTDYFSSWTFDDLAPETLYYVRIAPDCPEGNYEPWSDVVTFTTPEACPTVVEAQDVVIDDVQAHEVSLDWGDSPATAEQWQVCYSYYNMLPPESSMSENAVMVNGKYTTIDGLVPDLEYHFWIRALCDVWNDTPEWGEWSDMITVHTAVSCSSPTNVTVSDITSSSAYISWEPGSANQIEWEVTIESSDWGDPYVAIVDEPFLELDFGEGWLEEEEDLPCTVYVSANCGTTDGWSAASEIVGFILTDKDQLTVNDGENVNSNVPIYGLWVDQFSKSQFIIPAEDIVDMQYSEISWMTFYADSNYIDWGNARFEVYMMELPCETEFTSATLFDWDDMELVRSEGRLGIRDGQMVVDLEEPYFYTDGNLVIGFKEVVKGTYKSCSWYGVNQTGNTAVGGFEYAKGIGFQQFLPKTSFVYEPSDIMVCKKPRNFSAGFVDDNILRFAWTPGSEDQTKWHIAYAAEDNFDPENPTWPEYIVSVLYPYTQFDYSLVFEPETTYYFSLRAVCDDDNHIYSDWSCPISITMPEVCPKPKDITISNITSTEATINWVSQNDAWISMYRTDYDDTYCFETETLEGWTTQGPGTWTVASGDGDHSNPIGAHYGNYNAIITHSESDNETWLISPMMDLTNVDIAYLDFWYINRNWSGDVDELGVYYRIDEGDWNLLFITAEAHETWTNERVNLSSLATNDNCQIGFKMTDYYGYGVGLDDIQISGYKYAGGNWAYSPAQSFTFTNLNPNTTYSFYMISNCDGEDGSVTDWFYFTTEGETTVTQTIELAAGWNWFSAYVEGDAVDLIQALENSLGDKGITIKDSDNSTDYYGEEYGWYGELDDLGIANEKMYLINVSESCTVELQGTPTNPADHTITINPGWNWIGFPSAEALSVAVALAEFPAEDGDVLKGSEISTDYYEDFGWFGGLQTLEPGQGYLYKYNGTTPQTLTFQTGAKVKK